MPENGWATWGEPRVARTSKRLDGVQTVRYCPRCDDRTVWTLAGNENHPELQACGCGLTVATQLDLDELDNVRRHFRLTTGQVDDMVGLPLPDRI